MKDQLVVLVEAMRLARLELACYRDPNCKASAEWTVRRLSELLASNDVSGAISALTPDEDSGPPLVPDDPIDMRCAQVDA